MKHRQYPMNHRFGGAFEREGRRGHHPEDGGASTPGDGDRPHFRGGRGGHHGGGGGGPHGGGRHQGGFGERGEHGRARRGGAKYLLLDALNGGPKHGYEIIKSLEERSGGRYAPSPGVVYPTLQFLAEANLVRAEQNGDRRVFTLTETGQAELTAHAEEVAAFWGRFAAPAASAARAEIGFVEEELEYLTRAVWGGLRGTEDTEIIRRVRQTLENCRNDVRRIIADAEEKEV